MAALLPSPPADPDELPLQAAEPSVHRFAWHSPLLDANARIWPSSGAALLPAEEASAKFQDDCRHIKSLRLLRIELSMQCGSELLVRFL